MVVLELNQAGLSWATILKKRANFKRAFDNFNIAKVAAYGPAKIASLLKDEGIIRNRLKIVAARTNARAFLEVQAEFGTFSDYIWGFVDGEPVQNRWRSQRQVPATSPISDALSKDLKRRGFKFVGSTIIYAHMQATGMVNDHITGCYRYKECAALA